MFSLGSSEVQQGMSMRIQELAARAGTTTRTLRYYEAQGLLPVDRSANGYRRYDEFHVRLVREIRSLQAIGFSLEEVRPFIECLLTGHESGDECPASVDAYRSKVAFLDERIGQLQEARARLTGRLAEIDEPHCEMLAGRQLNDLGK
jgi:DNA-binding transcriptional MerR regulator